MQKELKRKVKKGAIIGGIVGLSYVGASLGLDIISGETVKNLEFILKGAAYVTASTGIGAVGGIPWHYLGRAEEYITKKIDAYFI